MSDRRPERDPLLGKVIGEYLIESRIGAGATGIVYRATHVRLHKPFALKVLHENLGRISSLKRRFEREARALARLAHPSIVHIVDFGVSADATYLAMELLEGETLEHHMQRGPVEPTDVLRILRPVLAGLAKFLSIDELSGEITLTRKGRIVGTPAYMSPEQITGVSLDVRADVYAAGVLLFEMLADRRPFDYERRSELLRAHLFEAPPELSALRPGLRVDASLEAIVRKALEKDPAARFADAGEMLRALEALPGTPVTVPGRTSKRRQRRREDSTSVVFSAHDMQELASSISEAGLASATLQDLPVFPGAGEVDTKPPHARADLTPLGGLPFEALGVEAGVDDASSEPKRSLASQLAPWLVLALISFFVGALGQWLVERFGGS